VDASRWNREKKRKKKKEQIRDRGEKKEK